VILLIELTDIVNTYLWVDSDLFDVMKLLLSLNLKTMQAHVQSNFEVFFPY
jgi:hypothetical protein